ncbi:hypothetical protein [Brevundimonas lenta]|uniref:Uncharacterized protein n=1 Tax=Brevundimonas lenta TaxID=424796 RepID=A0A7W6JEK3_9CAUL|nr:hypothetical protein [Brevundimonas lenta]MBB4083708.1 hypothetical protein [Brevundimonas lenta]
MKDLARDIARQEAAIAPAAPPTRPPKPAPPQIGARERIARKILAIVIAIWSCFIGAWIAVKAGLAHGVLAGVGAVAFTAAVGVGLYFIYLFQWGVAKEVAGWFRRDRPRGDAG